MHFANSMHPADIKAALQKRGYWITDVARGLGVTPSAVSLIVRGEKKSRRVAREISRLTGIPVGRLFPGQYPALETNERAA